MTGGRRRAARMVRGLYGMIDDGFTDEPVETAGALLAAGCTVMQVRCKTLSGARLREALDAIALLCADRNALLIVNDHVEAAAEIPGAGVHLGQEDAHPRLVRTVLGPDRVIGVSTHDDEELDSALRFDADYVGYGAVFGTATKGEGRRPPEVGLGGLRAACAGSPVPVVAIGGITLDTIGQTAGAGAAAAAVISDLYRSGSIEERARKLRLAFEAGRPRLPVLGG